MANFTAADVKALREQTGAGMMDVKKALTEANGDAEKALEIIRLKGLKSLSKREGRQASAGLLAAQTDGTVGVLVEVNSETDFVAKNQKFIDFSNEVLAAAVASGAADLDALLAAPMGEGTVKDRLDAFAAIIGEKLQVGRIVRVEGENVDLYLHTLGVPARRNVNDPEVKRGEQMFYQAKCHLCHVTTLHTRPRGATLLAGTELPWLGNQTIHPYSDYLLHDMGSEIMGVGLNDHYVSGLARGCEWRTTPLWGIGLQEKVDGHTYFLHDGRARNFTEAILWHGGEGEASKRLFMKMPKKDRQALIKFLESL